MVSFIVIGKNEGWKLEKCFNSIFKLIQKNNLDNYEVIYVDSDSTDNSIKIAKGFSEIKIFILRGNCNAAIGRNVGAKKSKGDILFFIDGDMELLEGSANLINDKKIHLEHPFISGQFNNYFYDTYSGEIIGERKSWNNNKDIYTGTTGGLFIIERKLWEKINGMQNKYRISQDLDLGLRLAKTHNLLLRKSILIANHYTIDYKSTNRLWKDILLGNFLYANCVLLRDHFFNKYFWKYYLRRNYSLIIIIILIFFQKLFIPFALLYLLIIGIRSIKTTKGERVLHKISVFLSFIIRDILSIIGIILFWPHKKYNYKIINI